MPVRVKPKGTTNQIKGVRDGVLLISVSAAPVDGAANAALIEVLAKALGCAKSTLEVVKGQKSREKSVGVSGLGLEEIALRLTTLLAGA